MKQIIKQLRDLVRASNLSYPEVRAFEAGISTLPLENQVELYRLFNTFPDLIYPTFVNYMAKRRAVETGADWDDAVDAELKFLETYIEGKRVGDEVK
jgi:hypothetical protein